MRYALSITILLTLIIFLLAAPCSAIYSFEGLPLEITAQGGIKGDIVSSWTLGLDAPPYMHQFILDNKPVWARVYTGVWGGTEKYRGWAEIDVNGNKLEKITFYGEDDMNEQVYESGNGVYWIEINGTGLVSQGKNTVTVTTSRGEPNNKLDGRVYGILVIALVESELGPVTQYWIADGNENLHGEGWAGTNPTRHDTSVVTFEGISTGNIRSAALTTLLLTSTQGQPDYLMFNGKDLGVPGTPAADYIAGAIDIGNERSSDASGGTGTDTRYVDFEVFEVTSLIKNKNEIVFQRGRDLNGDGAVTTTGTLSEGEDYIHPVLAMLTIQREGDSLPPDLSVDPLTITDAYEGEMATLTTTIRNTGLIPTSPAEVVFSVDDNRVDSQQVMLDYRGMKEVQGRWQATPGNHVVKVSVTVSGDSDTSNNEVSRAVRVGSPPDLAVSLGDLGSAAATGTRPQDAPFPLAGACAGGVVMIWWMKRKGTSPTMLPSFLLVTGIVGLAMMPVVSGAGTEISQFSIPVVVTNSGGSDAPSFLLTLYLDGERIAEHEIPNGISAGGTITENVPVFTTSGRHTLRVVADEAGTIPEKDRSNNSAERVYEFS